MESVASFYSSGPKQLMNRITIPIPKGYRPSKNSPFTVVDSEGNDLPTQWEPATFYPNKDVKRAEILWDGGEGSDFELQVKEQAFEKPQFDKLLVNTLLSPYRIALIITDMEDNDHYVSLTSTFSNFRKHKWGKIATEVETWSPFTSHYGHVNTFWNLERDSKSLLLDLLLTNGNVDNPVGDLRFKSLRLVVPLGMRVQSAWPIYLGQIEDPEGKPFTCYDLVNPDEGPHVFKMGDTTFLKLGFTFEEDEAILDARLTNKGQAKLNHDHSAWSEEAFGSWLSNSHPKPDLDHLDPWSDTELKIDQKYDLIIDALEEGKSYFFNNGANRMGLSHPYGSFHYGATGGDDIEHAPGIDALNERSWKAASFHEARLRMVMNKHTDSFFRGTGLPLTLEDLPGVQGATWEYFNGFGFIKKDVFGLITAKNNSNKVEYHAPYEWDIQRMESHDLAHYSRAILDAEILVNLINSSVSKRWLHICAERTRIELNDNTNLGKINAAGDQTPHNATAHTGRSEGWGGKAMAAWYSTLSEQETPQYARDWLRRFLEGHYKIQTLGSGTYVAQDEGKPASHFNYQYRAAQFFENSHINNAIHAIFRSFAEGVDSDLEDKCRSMFDRAAFGAYQYWWIAGQGPELILAMGPVGEQSKVFEFKAQIPADGHLNPLVPDRTNICSMLAYSILHTNNEQLRAALMLAVADYAGKEALGTDTEIYQETLDWFEFYGLSNVDNRAPIIWYLQQILGQ